MTYLFNQYVHSTKKNLSSFLLREVLFCTLCCHNIIPTLFLLITYVCISYFYAMTYFCIFSHFLYTIQNYMRTFLRMTCFLCVHINFCTTYFHFIIVSIFFIVHTNLRSYYVFLCNHKFLYCSPLLVLL